MRSIDFPSEVKLRVSGIRQRFPGRYTLASVFDDSLQTIETDFPSWQGVANINPTNDPDGAAAIEGWFIALDGQVNWTELPLKRPTLGSGITGSVDSSAVSSGVLKHTLSVAISSIEQNMWVRSGSRVFHVERVQSNGLILTLIPQLPLPSGSTISRALTIRARSDDDDMPQMLRTNRVYGPYDWRWREAP